MEDTRAAWAFVGIVVAVKVLVGVLLLLLLPVGEVMPLYIMVHLAAILGPVLLILLAAGSLLFWWRILRLRTHRRDLLWAEWHMD
ncbi:MAG: hypothetical protein HY688_05285 [Chloroflexi bacterium]|nr:hypothetical protein [Chloroflexota bacterium]